MTEEGDDVGNGVSRATGARGLREGRRGGRRSKRTAESAKVRRWSEPRSSWAFARKRRHVQLDI